VLLGGVIGLHMVLGGMEWRVERARVSWRRHYCSKDSFMAEMVEGATAQSCSSREFLYCCLTA